MRILLTASACIALHGCGGSEDLGGPWSGTWSLATGATALRTGSFIASFFFDGTFSYDSGTFADSPGEVFRVTGKVDAAQGASLVCVVGNCWGAGDPGRLLAGDASRDGDDSLTIHATVGSANESLTVSLARIHNK